jgi:hypothetical protein
MKTNTLLLLASLAVLTTGASAAQYPTENEVVVLPTYTLEAPRYLPVEKQINASLDEARQPAKAPAAIPAECSALKALVNQGSAIAMKARDEKTVRVAKL